MYTTFKSLRSAAACARFAGACLLAAFIGAEPAAAARLAYIAETSGTLHVMNTASRHIEATIPSPVRFTPVALTAFARDPAGSFVYEGLTDQLTGSSGLLAIVDARANAVAATVPIGAPRRIVTSANGTFVYVLTGGLACCQTSKVTVLNSGSHSVVATIPVSSLPGDLVAHPIQSIVYASDYFGRMLVIDTNTNTVSATLQLDTGSTTGAMTVHPAGTLVYVVGSTAGTVFVVNALTNAVVATVPVGAEPREIAMHPSGALVYVANWQGGTVSVIDTLTNTVAATVPVGPGPDSLRVDPGGRFLYVLTHGAAVGSKVLSVIDIASRRVVRIRPEEYGIANIEVDRDGAALYVLNNATNNVEVLSAAGDSSVASVPISSPAAMVFGMQVAAPPAAALEVPTLSAALLVLTMAALGALACFRLAHMRRLARPAQSNWLACLDDQCRSRARSG